MSMAASALSVSIKSEDSFKSLTKSAAPMKAGDSFPHITLTSESGSPIALHAQNNRPKLVVFYRGAFCNFCEESLLEINSRMRTFEADGIDVVAVSTDTVKESKELSQSLGLRFPIACGLTVDQMENLGLYIHTSDPKTSPKFAYRSSRRQMNYVGEEGRESCAKMWRRPFCEPAHFFLRPNNTIKYCSQPDALYHL